MRAPQRAVPFLAFVLVASACAQQPDASANTEPKNQKTAATQPAASSGAQAMPVKAPKRETQPANSGVRRLTIVKTFPSEASELLKIIGGPTACDAEGNSYSYVIGLSPDHVMPDNPMREIVKLGPTGKRLATFDLPALPDVKTQMGWYFTVTPEGELYQLVYAHELSRYIFVYAPDGSFKSKIKTQPPFAWGPAQLARFPSGRFLVTGQKLRKDLKAPMLPFTGILAADGKLLKEVSLEGDPWIPSTGGLPPLGSDPSSNRAITSGAMEMGSDGNVYLMRWSLPAVIYVINAGGEVVRRLTLDPGAGRNLWPFGMRVSKQRIAVFFSDLKELTLVKVIDLEGNEVASYENAFDDEKQRLGSSFACYRDDPEQFTFLTIMKGGGLGIQVVGP